MVPVAPSRGAVALQWPTTGAPAVALDGFLIDLHEVTNEEFRRFVDAGGYRDARFWTEPFIRNKRSLSFQEAVAAFADATGRPGPSTWEGGSYPKGMDKYPVAGVSWFEAAAYARFVGKTLPTAYHWTYASQASDFASLIAAGGNFSRRGTQPVGGVGTTSGYGTTDMAGNVKEWCVNATRDGARFALGGGFGDPSYEFSFTHTEDPWARRANIGFRCVKLDRPSAPAASATIDAPVTDWSKRKPASDEALDAFKREYAYDRAELSAQVEEAKRARDWTHERVTFAAAYGSERVTAHVFTPVNAAPPFQAVVYVPGGYSMVDDKLPLADVEDSLGYLMRNGRALVMPIYKGTYERRDGVKPDDQNKRPEFFRDHLIMAAKDLSRTLDYLETRKDIDASRLGFIGLSYGAKFAPVFLVVEPRLKAAVLDSGGFAPYEFPADMLPLNFVTRVHVPTLMLNGRYDSDFPLESAQRPFFNLLGTPAADKRHVVFEAAHGDFPVQQQIRETLDWFDKYLGAVQRR
jgi:dienelactone hydrolase